MVCFITCSEPSIASIIHQLHGFSEDLLFEGGKIKTNYPKFDFVANRKELWLIHYLL